MSYICIGLSVMLLVLVIKAIRYKEKKENSSVLWNCEGKIIFKNFTCFLGKLNM